MGAFACGCVKVHTLNPGAWKERCKLLLNPLSPDAEKLNVCTFAIRALRMRGSHQPTVVAAEMPLRKMIRKRDAAVVTPFGVAAVWAFNEWSKAPPVLQQDDSLLPLKTMFNLLLQGL